ncbi:hypothetical protein BH10ACT9_BH10ACT9_36570 [soil metagenome]
MAYVRAHETKQKRSGKLVKRYEVIFAEPICDEFGRPIPKNPSKPDGAKKMRSRQESYSTRAAAEERKDELNNAKHSAAGTTALADQRKAGAQTFGLYAAGWLAEQQTRLAEGTLKIGTFDNYERILAHDILPRFGSRAIAAITFVECAQFRAELSTRLGSSRSVRNVWWPLVGVFRYAAKAGALTASPAEQISDGRRRNPSRPVDGFAPHPLTGPQVASLAQAVGERSHLVYELMVKFLCYSGLRKAELQGLEIRDLMLSHSANGITKGNVRVERTKTRRRGKWITGSTKSEKSRRTVPLPGWLAAQMADYLNEVHPLSGDPSAPLWPNRVQGGARRKGELAEVVFDWSEPIDLPNFTRRTLRPALETVGLPVSRARTIKADGTVEPAVSGFRLHDTRHTFAVLLLTSGVHHMQVSRWLGHSSFVITMTVYADWLPEDETANTLPEPVPARTNVVSMTGRASGAS